MKKKIENSDSVPRPKKRKIEKPKNVDLKKNTTANQNLPKKPSKFIKSDKKGDPTNLKEVKAKQFLNKTKKKPNTNQTEKVEDWKEFKKKKKELKLKRRQNKVKDSYSVIVKAKQIGEQLRRKIVQPDKRTALILELHTLLKDSGHYSKFVLSHDTARIVQWLLKYSDEKTINEISVEILPITVDMLQSKYGIFCAKRLLKYGQSEIRSKLIDNMMGNVVKLSSHSISAPVVEYAFSTWATNPQKQFLIQEFYGDLYKNSKDKNVKHLNDVYKNDETLKKATLSSVKANIQRIMNKTLLDSGLVQSVLRQFLEECSIDDKNELISQLASHIVVISNSKDGSRAAMMCIWNSSNKDRKTMMKNLKEHVVELSKHEFGHCTVITMLDCIDDTVLLHKIIISELLKNAKDLALSDYGRKVLLWLISPDDTSIFHPVFINELKKGRESSTSKKPVETRRKEILNYAINTLLELIINEAEFWLKNGSLAVELLAIIKAGCGEHLQKALKSISSVICDPNWKISEDDTEIQGIEHPGIHLVLKKLAQNDKAAKEIENNSTFGNAVIDSIGEGTLQHWIKFNRGCFVLVAIFENNSGKIQEKLKNKLKKHVKVLKKSESPGAKILLKKVS